MSAPSTVLFDIGGTLLTEIRFELEAGLRAVLPNASDVSSVAEEWRAIVRDNHAAQADVLLAQWLIEHVAQLRGVPVDVIEDVLWPAVVTLVPSNGVRAVLERLERDGIRMAAVSNTSFSGRILSKELDRHGLGGFFSLVLSSGDLGVRKPAPGIFDEALRQMHAFAADTWFVGDTFHADILGAMNAGLLPIWICQEEPVPDAPAPVHIVRDWGAFLELYRAGRNAAT
jgi:FMN phosphatase YigB (HAD superfamily)